MPELKGLGKSTAEQKLRGLGLAMSVREERFSPAAPYGSVLEQDIEPGATIKRGRTVELILSKGTKIVGVPRLLGMSSARQARLVLEQNGLELAFESQVHDESLAGTVLAQAPEAGTELARGSRVSLLLSLGPAKAAWVMPEFNGMDGGLVREAVKKMALVLRRVTEKEAPQARPGSVIFQSLSPGARIEEGSELSLVLASGEASLEGARLADLTYDLPESGVAERRVLFTVTDRRGRRVVYNRMVAPGQSAKVQARVFGQATVEISVGGELAETREIE
jgi:serine/threonine-protein kinase